LDGLLIKTNEISTTSIAFVTQNVCDACLRSDLTAKTIELFFSQVIEKAM
jgi:hypothetical protein